MNIPDMSPLILNKLDQINIRWHGNYAIVATALEKLQKSEVRRGINFCLSKQYEKDIPRIIALAEQYDAEILYLTYKAIAKDWKNQIMPSEVMKIAKKTEKQGVKVAVDGATCNVCLASKRFCDIDSQGNVMVCSFIRKPVGNLLEKQFKEIWSSRQKVTSCPYVKQK
jgi:MoaA/NifB/PqqE/SkfB family radical SAM enzyme